MSSIARPANILVVAPDDSLRRSLCFVLRAEGYGVRELRKWADDDGGPAFDAAVIDHGGIDRAAAADQVLRRLGARAVILSSHIEPPAHLGSATIVRKPLVGRELVDRLHTVLGDLPPTRPH